MTSSQWNLTLLMRLTGPAMFSYRSQKSTPQSVLVGCTFNYKQLSLHKPEHAYNMVCTVTSLRGAYFWHYSQPPLTWGVFEVFKDEVVVHDGLYYYCVYFLCTQNP